MVSRLIYNSFVTLARVDDTYSYLEIEIVQFPCRGDLRSHSTDLRVDVNKFQDNLRQTKVPYVATLPLLLRTVKVIHILLPLRTLWLKVKFSLHLEN